MPILILVLLLLLIVLFAQFGSNYYTQVKVIRRFFRNKGEAPEEYVERTSQLKDIDYNSIFPKGVLDLYTANDATQPQPVLLWVHGGGYVGGDKSCIAPWAPVLAADCHAAVVSINYCLAPEQHYPGPLIQLSEALRYLSEQADRLQLDTSRIFLGGDSAGAQIVSQYAALVHDTDLQAAMNLKPPIAPEQLRGILLCCGFYHMDTLYASHFPAIKTFMWAYTNCKKLRSFARKDEMSAVYHLKSGYPDVYLTCGDADPFLKQAHTMTDALAAAEIPTENYLPRVPGKKLGHEYQFSVGTTEGNIALRKAVDFIGKRL